MLPQTEVIFKSLEQMHARAHSERGSERGTSGLIFYGRHLTRVLHVNCGCLSLGLSVCPTPPFLNDLLPTVKNERNEAGQAIEVQSGKVTQVSSFNGVRKRGKIAFVSSVRI